ncbi:MAG: FAD-dependent oxidoreductase [Bacteroidetes bacterium]|nr:FAD-dependent oxidoreductase [Bacteroidota bacterium]
MQVSKNVNYSYWEMDQYFKIYDLIIIGSGIVGLSTAISFKQKNKKASILILEKGILPSGASTKNAGFACFGSASELLDDLGRINKDSVWDTVVLRWKGLELLRKRLGDKNIDYNNWGGYELFDNKNDFNYCIENIANLNKEYTRVLGIKKTYVDVSEKVNQFKNIKGAILNKYEGQINTGKMMHALTALAAKKDITLLNGIAVSKINDADTKVEIVSNAGIFKARKVVVATNGFAKELITLPDVHPARAQVLITKPIKNLKIKGTFHYQQGYYYFRNIDDRILFGGGRNLDREVETTTKMELNKKLQDNLDSLLKNMILPGIPYEVDHRWTGIMGVGSEKKPIIQFVSKNVLAAVRMGGMGVAIGSMVGELAAKKIKNT